MPTETFAEKDARFLAYGTWWARESSLLNMMVDASTVSDDEMHIERARHLRAREVKFENGIFEKTSEILSWAMGDAAGLISTPIPTFENFAVKDKTATSQTLRVDIEAINVTKERIQEAKKFLNAEFQPEKDPDEFRMEKWKRDEGFTVGSPNHRNGFRVEFSLEAFTKLQKEIREKIAVLDEAILWYEKIRSIHEAELAQRGKDEPAEVARIMTELERTVKEGENQKKIVLKAARKCKDSGLKDREAAQNFLNAKRRFHELSGEHRALFKQLLTANVSGGKLDGITDFPLEPTPKTIDERMNWTRIERLASNS